MAFNGKRIASVEPFSAINDTTEAATSIAIRPFGEPARFDFQQTSTDERWLARATTQQIPGQRDQIAWGATRSIVKLFD